MKVGFATTDISGKITSVNFFKTTTMKKYIVTYTDDDGGIATTEQQTFTDHNEACNFYDEQISRDIADVFLCEVIKEGELKSE